MDPSNDWTKDLIDWAEENIIFNKIYENYTKKKKKIKASASRGI